MPFGPRGFGLRQSSAAFSCCRVRSHNTSRLPQFKTLPRLRTGFALRIPSRVMLTATLRSRSFSAALHAALWLLLVLALVGIGGGRSLQYREAEPDPTAVTTPVPVARLEKLFAAANWPKQVVGAGSSNAFYTTHFIPPPPPP